MGVFDSITRKRKETKEKRSEISTKIDNYMSQVNSELSHNKDYIGAEFAQTVKDTCCELGNAAMKYKSGLSGKKLYAKIKELTVLSRDIEQSVSHHNDAVATERSIKVRSIIGSVEGRSLDDQQIKCIIIPARNHLVIAGAGTGKTTTIVGKVKYLLNSGVCEAKDILVLSFTNNSAAEMCERIKNETGRQIEAVTFHKLGLDIIRIAEGIAPKITQIQIQPFVRQKLEENMKKPGYLSLLCRYFISNYKYEKSEFDFTSLTEYDNYLRINPPVTINGEKVKSYGEMDIANFLFQNGIRYEYERQYEIDTRTAERYQYYPDFYLPDYKIYIEYFGINEKGEVPSYFTQRGTKSASEEYRVDMEWKKNLHKKQNTVLVDCYAYERFNGNLLSLLEEKLKNHGVVFQPISAEELWNRVSENNSSNVLTGISELISTLISLMKSNEYDIERLRAICSENLRGDRSSAIIDILEPIYLDYVGALKQNDEIDFNDMINRAAKMIREGRYVNPYKHVIIDEYQDISKARFNLLKALRDSSDYELFCVGDDWQSIYRFAGSDMDYIVNFSKYWGPTQYSKIETTYRFSDSLIDISGKFIMQNPSQIKKSMRGISNGMGFALGEIKGYNERLALRFALDRLRELPRNSSVFFLGRYSFDCKLLDECEELKCTYDNARQRATVSFAERPDLKMEFLTAHRSKGLQADYVFIINNKDYGMGFPSKIQDDPLVDCLLEGKEEFPYAEERRLFYVALTRAKVKTFLLTVEGNESEFASEMEKRYDSELRREMYTCPWCGGRLEKRRGKYGDFWGCENYRNKGCKFTRADRKSRN